MSTRGKRSLAHAEALGRALRMAATHLGVPTKLRFRDIESRYAGPPPAQAGTVLRSKPEVVAAVSGLVVVPSRDDAGNIIVEILSDVRLSSGGGL